MSLTPGIAVDIVSADCLGGHRLRLTFSDGHVTTVDFGPFLRAAQHPQTGKFLEASLFRKFSLVYGNLVWGDHEMCFPVDDLYEGKIEHREEFGGNLAVAENRAEYIVKEPKRRRKKP